MTATRQHVNQRHNEDPYACSEDLDRDEVGILGDAIGAASDRAGDVGAVPARVNVGTASKVGTVGCSPAKLLVVDVDSGVDDIGVGSTPSAVVVDILAGGGLTVRDSAEAPFGVVLRDQSRHVAWEILLDELDL